jgi:hypothetical protein
MFRRVGLRGALVGLPILANVLLTLPITQASANRADNAAPQGIDRGQGAEKTAACEVGPAKRQLAEIDSGAQPTPLFLALPELSGKLRYHLGVQIFAIGQHRYQSGFRPMLEAFRSTDMGEVEGWMRETGIDAVVICNTRQRKGSYFREMEHDDYFYRRLQLDDPPAFLKPYELDYSGLKAYVLRDPAPSE